MERQHYSEYTRLVKIILQLLQTVVDVLRELCVRAINGSVARWFLCVEHDGEQVKTIL